jgi:fucose 4-O-acetylase-like acetyltransferase
MVTVPAGASQPRSDLAATEPDLPGTVGGRDHFIDFVRAFSLIVVVIWHWSFTILKWLPDGPHATNPIGFTDGLWLVTWLLQVMPLFFFVGGYAHQQSYRRKQARGTSMWAFVGRRLTELTVPAVALAGVWIVLGVVVAIVFEASWIKRSVLLVISPLWFIGVYLLLIAMFPIWDWLHRRFGALVLLWLAGLSMLVDVLRFSHEVDSIAWLNMIFVWGFCHQLGFFYGDLVRAPRRAAWMLTWGGLFALSGLVYSNAYPGSMVGVPGERFSNMAPPTVCIAALVLFQSGVALLLRDATLARLRRPRWERASRIVNRFSMPLFLFHTTGFAISFAIGYLIKGERRFAEAASWQWWVGRPLALVTPLIWTAPVIWLFGRRMAKSERSAPSAAPSDLV